MAWNCRRKWGAFQKEKKKKKNRVACGKGIPLNRGGRCAVTCTGHVFRAGRYTLVCALLHGYRYSGWEGGRLTGNMNENELQGF